MNSSTWQLALGACMMLTVPGYFGLQWVLLRRLSGGWRLAAAMPLVVIVPALLATIVMAALRSNLWPIFIVVSAPPAFLYLLAVAALERRAWGKGTRERRTNG